MNLGKWIRPMIVAMLFGAFLTGQSRYAMADETEAETAPPSAAAPAQTKEEESESETREQMEEPEDADLPEETKEIQGIEMLSAIDGDSTLTMRREDGRLFSEESMAQIERLSGEEETRAHRTPSTGWWVRTKTAAWLISSPLRRRNPLRTSS